MILKVFYLDRAADTQIKFVANKIQGITDDEGLAHVVDNPATWSSWDEMKSPSKLGSRSYLPDKYINIWVTKLPDGMSSYASSIYRDVGSDVDGIVLDAQYFNKDPGSPYGQGKTLTHLMGNYLGLYDLWSEDRPCEDDYVDDTPIHNALNYGKPFHRHVSTCDKQNIVPEMLMNFMDNSDDELQTMFTAGQVLRMHAVLSLVRDGLLSHNQNSNQ